MKKSFLASILFFLSASAGVCAPIWPLKIPISQSSSFAEQRGFRHHAGIDLRTGHKNGVPVLAIEDGYVSRVGVTFRGYGNALYIDHPKLKARVVYGHLQEFAGPLKEYTEKKLQRLGSHYGINDYFLPGKFPVKKGQVVAYSGESGAGPSHLHFEMRTLKDEPISPSLFGLRVPDKIFPKFHHFYIEPMGYKTVINNSFLPYTSDITKQTASRSIIKDTPVVCGKIGMQCGVSDSNQGNVFGIEKISLMLNGKRQFQRGMYKFSYSDNRQAPLVFDYFKTSIRKTGYVYNLFKLPWETIDFSSGWSDWSGVTDTSKYPAGRLNFIINSCDYGLNYIRAEGAVTCRKITFRREIPNVFLKNLKDFVTVQTLFSCVSCAKQLPSEIIKLSSPVFGHVRCSDFSGRFSDIPCIVREGEVEFCFPLEARWEKGAWYKDIQILEPSVFVGSKGGLVNNGGASVAFAENSLHIGKFITLKPLDISLEPVEKEERGSLTPLTKVWELKPDNRVFDKEAELSISYGSYYDDTEKLGIYKFENGKIEHYGEGVDKGCLKSLIRTGGRFVIMEDSYSPELKYLGKRKLHELGQCLVFGAADEGEGVNYLSGEALIDGCPAEVLSDPDRKEFYVKFPEDTHGRVVLQIKDNAGNKSSLSVKR